MGYTVTEGNYEKLGVQASGDAVTFSVAGEKEENCAVVLYEKNRSNIAWDRCVLSVDTVFHRKI